MHKATAHKKTPPYIVKRSKAGLGLFAQKTFTRGEFIIEYTGELIPTAEADRRGGKYLFVVSDSQTIDGKGRANIARYINHSCTPNAEAELNEDELRVRIYAKKKILPGEEILYDYGSEYWEEHINPYGCRCATCVT
jgi:SET domain-containing protein